MPSLKYSEILLLNFSNQTAEVIDFLKIEDTPRGTIKRYWLNLVADGLGMPIYLPVIVARGQVDGKVLGLTAAVHGNELNGIPVIQRLFADLEVGELKGTLVGVPVVNVPSLHRRRRRFVDGTDLNHIMPGKANGNVSQVYAYRLVHRLIHQLDFLVDLHTASFGRVNSYYIRADMSDAVTRRMAMLQNAQIIVDNPPSDGTLRGAANELGISAITLEVGDPQRFQRGMIRSSMTGIYNLLRYLEMTQHDIEEPNTPTVLCKKSYWIFSDEGGILRVHPQVTDAVKKGEKIATLRNVFGDIVREFFAPEPGIVIGKQVNPIVMTGGRILHLGIIK